jgi:threonine synthase
MIYYSLNKQAPWVDFKEATILGQAPDKGLYFPLSIPVIPGKLIDNINNYSREEIAFEIIRPYIGDSIPIPRLKQIVEETICFDFPLVKLSNDVFALELFHGPTLAFKDVGARFMSRCLGYFMEQDSRNVTVLVATSGDTGGAVANGFYGVDGVNVVILYPSGKVSSVQEWQLTTLGKNVTALEILGSFDDCQDLVKQAFADHELKQKVFLTSANSINVARWLPQQFYYLFAYQQWEDKSHPPVFSVPSGNFGNICAGLLANRSGLPVRHFIAACNANDIFPEFLRTQNYKPKKAVATLSNAMDVGNPSNFIRILELFNNEFIDLSIILSSYSISDDETVDAISALYKNNKYVADPHGAVGWIALKKWLNENKGEKGIFLETAHPVKFYDIVEPIINQKIPLPESVDRLQGKKKLSRPFEASYKEFREFLFTLK